MAQIILDQRTDLETFFLEALEQIREEARRKRIEDQKNGIVYLSRRKMKIRNLNMEIKLI